MPYPPLTALASSRRLSQPDYSGTIFYTGFRFPEPCAPATTSKELTMP